MTVMKLMRNDNDGDEAVRQVSVVPDNSLSHQHRAWRLHLYTG